MEDEGQGRYLRRLLPEQGPMEKMLQFDVFYKKVETEILPKLQNLQNDEVKTSAEKLDLMAPLVSDLRDNLGFMTAYEVRGINDKRLEELKNILEIYRLYLNGLAGK
jgi:hypothetical protein